MVFVLLVVILLFKTWICYAAQAGLELAIPLLESLKCWNLGVHHHAQLLVFVFNL
jgi:hypothetical protein